MKNTHQVMRSLCLPLALPVRAKRNCGNTKFPQYKIDISAKYRLMPSFGGAKITFFNKNLAERKTVPLPPVVPAKPAGSKVYF